MKLFTVGPVQMYPRTLELSKKQLPYFRDSEFSEMMLTMEKRLNSLLSLSPCLEVSTMKFRTQSH